ncbi:hypothetical protein H109_04616 [Trichophyton interdigitale MR816]|uniref:Uncharacterized protein n=1 Tax=Trichophyton interdigitale (strain MR816) TaxID=1215338 RepID=A0A059J722_TRIIM|nr:hypothetical protein H109_04616 [Trichophyton interdigitale MR816]
MVLLLAKNMRRSEDNGQSYSGIVQLFRVFITFRDYPPSRDFGTIRAISSFSPIVPPYTRSAKVPCGRCQSPPWPLEATENEIIAGLTGWVPSKLEGDITEYVSSSIKSRRQFSCAEFALPGGNTEPEPPPFLYGVHKCAFGLFGIIGIVRRVIKKTSEPIRRSFGITLSCVLLQPHTRQASRGPFIRDHSSLWRLNTAYLANSPVRITIDLVKRILSIWQKTQFGTKVGRLLRLSTNKSTLKIASGTSVRLDNPTSDSDSSDALPGRFPLPSPYFHA